MIDSITKTLSISISMYKRSTLLWRGNSTQAVYKATPNQSGVGNLKRNKHQLLHRIQSIRTFTNLQYNNEINKFGNNSSPKVGVNLYPEKT